MLKRDSLGIEWYKKKLYVLYRFMKPFWYFETSVNTLYKMNHVINLLIYVVFIRKEQNIRKSLFYCLGFLLLMVVWTGLRNIWSCCFKPCSKSINARSIRFVNWLQLPLNRWFISNVYFMVLVIGIRDQSNCNPDQNTIFMFLFKSAIFSLKNTKYPFMSTELILGILKRMIM